eukprot:427911-Amphidinium_carterae.1
MGDEKPKCKSSHYSSILKLERTLGNVRLISVEGHLARLWDLSRLTRQTARQQKNTPHFSSRLRSDRAEVLELLP